MEWSEPLPAQCPPKEAVQPENDVFYRLADTNPPSERDFSSQRRLFPSKVFNANECIVRSISVHDNVEACAKIIKLPIHKTQKLVEIVLPPESGVVMQTGKIHHYSWWRAKGFLPENWKVVV